jgi:lambda family phage portal protein
MNWRELIFGREKPELAVVATRQRDELLTGWASGRENGIRSSTVEPWHAGAIRADREHNQKMTRMYEASITSNLNLDFVPTVNSGNAEVLVSLYIGRGRARTLEKDDACYAGILNADMNNICGDDPFRLEMQVRVNGKGGNIQHSTLNAQRPSGDQTGKVSGGTPETAAGTAALPGDDDEIVLDTAVNKRIEGAWRDYGRKENCTVKKDMSRAEMWWLAIASMKRDGSILFRHHREFPFNKSRYAIEPIESDRLQESYTGKSEQGNPIRFSIERHRKYGFALNYWILTRHPGEVFAYNGPTPNTWRERVPAEDIIHFNNIRTRADQDIGFPAYAPIIQHLHLCRQFTRAHVTAAIWAQAKPYFIIQDYPTGSPYIGDPSPYANAVEVGNGNAGPEGGAPGRRGDGRGGGRNPITAVEPATGEELQMGKKPFLVDPKFPNENAPGFMKNQYEMVAAGSGKAYSTVSCDVEKNSFSTMRSALVPERDDYRKHQRHMEASLVRPHFEAWLECELLYGTLMDLPFSRYEEFCKAAVFHAKRWPYIQPVQDAQADILWMEENIKSPQQVLAESEDGGNLEDIHAQIAAAVKSEKAHDIWEDPTVAMPSLKKGPPGQPQAAANQPAAKPGTGKGKRNGADWKRAARNGMLRGQEDRE